MTVDFRFLRAPKHRVASLRWKGPWSETKIRANFRRVAAWAEGEHLRTGVWIFREPGEREWEVMVEIRGTAHPPAPIRLKTLPAGRVASVVFDPEQVSPRVIYHGLSDWLRWRRKDRTIRAVGSYREVYADDPWKNPKAWARTEVQAEVR